MRLSDFILHDMDAIVAEWEVFAATLLPAAAGMTQLALRDHAREILQAVAKDIASPQTREEQAEKSKGWAPEVAVETAAQTHAVLRARSRFDIKQLVAEYRALRASVLRSWLDSGQVDGPGIQEVIRFSEAIDQAVAESVEHFHTQVERARNLLLGMLGHDMRSPLGTIFATASHLAALNAGEEVSVAAVRLLRSGASMQALLDDLLDFNRAQLGLGVRVRRSEVDLASVVTDELDQLRGAYPDRRIELTVEGDSRVRCDRTRMQQLLRNLVTNAIRYGEPRAPIRVALLGERADLRLQVTNEGPGIDPSAHDQIFDPLSRLPIEGDAHHEAHGLGLGLFIVREVAKAHDGEVEVSCDGVTTTFSVRLPRYEGSAYASPSLTM